MANNFVVGLIKQFNALDTRVQSHLIQFVKHVKIKILRIISNLCLILF